MKKPSPAQEVRMAKTLMYRVVMHWRGDDPVPAEISEIVEKLETHCKIDREYATRMNFHRKIVPNPEDYRNTVMKRRYNSTRIRHLRLRMQQLAVNYGINYEGIYDA